MSSVRLQSVRKTLGNRVVLDDVTLDLPAGETTAVPGESGCSKTTLLHHLTGLLRPDRGRVELFGQPIATGLALNDTGLSLRGRFRGRCSRSSPYCCFRQSSAG